MTHSVKSSGVGFFRPEVVADSRYEIRKIDPVVDTLRRIKLDENRDPETRANAERFISEIISNGEKLEDLLGFGSWLRKEQIQQTLLRQKAIRSRTEGFITHIGEDVPTYPWPAPSLYERVGEIRWMVITAIAVPIGVSLIRKFFGKKLPGGSS